MPVKKQKPNPNYDSNTVTIDSGYGAVPSDYIGGSMGTDTITLNNTLWSGNGTTYSIGGVTTSPYTISGSYNYNNNAVWTTTGTGVNSVPNTVHIDADGLTMKEGADIKIGGKSLTEAIEKIEERLGILHPNSALEERWETLKELRKQYMELEKDILEKEKLMKILKET